MFTQKEVLKYNQKREQSDIKRYKKYYGLNYKNKKNYDLIIDTTSKNPKQIIKRILQKIK